MPANQDSHTIDVVLVVLYQDREVLHELFQQLQYTMCNIRCVRNTLFSTNTRARINIEDPVSVGCATCQRRGSLRRLNINGTT